MTVSVGVLMIVLFGLISLRSIAVQLTPNLDTTVISVTTFWEGASPQEIENEVVLRQEEKLKGIPSLTKMTSYCRTNEGQITLEFVLGTSKDAALRDVSDRLREVTGYPDTMDEPVVRASNPQDRDYIAWIIMSTTDPAYDIRELGDFAEDHIKPEIERVAGVSEVNVLGGFEREIQVIVDPVRLAQRKLTYTRLVEQLRAQNRNASAGQLAEGKLDIRVRSVGRYERTSQVENTLLSRPGEPVVKVSDIGNVVLSHKEADRLGRTVGRTILSMNVQREVGANVIDVMEGVKQRIIWIRESLMPAEARRLGLSGELTIEQVYDQTIYIHQALDLVQQNLWIGGSLAVLVLLAFLRSFRSTLIIALAIPVSVVGTFLVMTIMGRSINVISLAGLAFAIGMVVDNAIVVLENIDRHRRLGRSPDDAAYRATREVWGAVLASTLTTLVVFIPVLTIQEEAGQLFRDISLAICAAVTLSLIVSVTVIPAACARWLPAARPPRNIVRRAVASLFGLVNVLGWLVRGFSRVIYGLGRSWVLRPLIIAALTIAAIAGSLQLMPPASYLPMGNRNLVFAMMFTPPGYNYEQKRLLSFQIEQAMRPWWEAGHDLRDPATLPQIPEIDRTTGEARMIDCPPINNLFIIATPDAMFMGASSVDEQNIRPLQTLMNNTLRQLPGVIGFAIQLPLFRTSGTGLGSGIDLELTGQNLNEISRVASALMRNLGGKFGFERVRPTPSNFDLPGPEIHVLLDPVAAADVGLTQQDINLAVQVLGDGAIVGEYLHEGDTIDLKVRALGGESGDAAYLAGAPIATPIGRIVPLSSVTNVMRTTAPDDITRVEQQRAITLQINLPEEYPLEAAMQEIEADIAAMRESGQMSDSIRHNMAGVAAKLVDVKNALLGEWSGFNRHSLFSLMSSRMFLALVVVFLLMAALFESWLYPLVIMFSVPLATVGGFLGLRIVHEYVPAQQLDVLTMLGFVILTGIVVNNAILIVHQTLNLIRGEADVQVKGEWTTKLEPREAIAESVRTRVRPIFMSMLTSVGGMMPLVLFPGAGSELYRGLGSVVVGGLIVSTIFTLLLVPLLLGIVFDIRALGSAIAAKVRPTRKPAPQRSS